MVKHRSIAAALGCLLIIGVGSAHAAEGASPEIDGKALLQKNCARCHSIEATGASPLKGAPPLREVYLKYPIEMLQYDLAEGFGSKHRDMPQIQFSSEQADAILDYLGGLVGKPPSQRAPAAMPPSPEGTEPP
jgi:mono/diheme cytochrome c family protein